jgi:isopentenyl-diphosphate Delta-isomerase
MEQVILVNENDEPIGLMEKMEAHEKAILHRAFSVFLMNDKHEMYLQQRALSKYHSGGLFTNACCSHQRANETTMDAAARRCVEELGFTVPLTPVFTFMYKASFDNGLTEHEFDHVLYGNCNTLNLDFNLEEVASVCFKSLDTIEIEMELTPEKYTAWFIIAFPKFKTWYLANKM